MGMLQFLKLSYVLIGNSVATPMFESCNLITNPIVNPERKKESSHLFEVWNDQPISLYSIFAAMAQ